MKFDRAFPEKALFYSLSVFFFCIPISMSTGAISGGVFLAAWALSLATGTRIRWSPWMTPVLLLMFIPWIGLLYTGDIPIGISYASKSYFWLFSFAAAAVCFERYAAEYALKAYVLGLSLSSIVSLLQFAGIVPLKKTMPIAFFYWHQTYSLLLALGVAIAFVLIAKSENRREKGLFIICFALILAALAIVPGRAGHLVFLLTIPFMLYTIVGQKNLLKILALSLAIGGLLFVSPVVRHRIADGMHDIAEYKTGNVNTSIGFRFHLWNSAADMILKHPIIGLGTGGFKEELKKYKTDPSFPDSSQPHNSFLYQAVSYGIFSVIPLIWLLYLLFKKGWEHRGSVAGFSVFSLAIMILVGSMFDSQIIMNGTGVLLALFTGLQEAVDGKQ